MMTIEEIINAFTNGNGLQVGINTTMASLRPGCLYTLQAGNGQFEIIDWPDNQWDDINECYIDQPTSQEIRDEYIRQQTIAEMLNYLKTKQELK